jgi:hypothetical protein
VCPAAGEGDAASIVTGIGGRKEASLSLGIELAFGSFAMFGRTLRDRMM